MGTHAPKAVFLSYASQDSDAARRVAEALRGSGIEVWFDQSELRGGEAWDQRIRKQIKECTLFLPVISAHTQARREGYFRLEWKLAEERTHLMAKGTPFVVPVCIDTTSERTALVPEAFLCVQWTRLPDGETPPAFGEQVKFLLTNGGYRDDTSWAPGAPPRIADYELLRLIGRGSYGDVWLARGVTGIYFAIKVVWRERFTDPGPFEREFRGLKEFAAISLGGSSQLALLHVGRNDEAGFFYYVMELADDADRGREIQPDCYVPMTLSEMRSRHGRLPVAECLTLGLNLARELAELHARGLVHRDIKPSNVILVGGMAKLADVGLVSRTCDARTFVGTEGYVPPEGPGSPTADVYALGKVLYEISTGLHRQQFPQLPPDFSRLPDHRALLNLNDVILRACDPQPERRYPDGRRLLSELLSLQARGRVRRIGRGPRVALVTVVAVVGLTSPWWSKWSLPARSTNPAPLVDLTVPLPQPTLPDLEKSLVVLPVEDLSPDPANAFFADGIQAEIIATLKQVPELRVFGRRAAPDPPKGSEPAFAELGRQLGVGNAIYGSLRRDKNRVRIILELQRCRDGVSLWSQTYGRESGDILGLQSEIADEVSRVLQAQATRDPRAAARFMTRDPRAYELYIEGLSPIEEDFGRRREDAVRVGLQQLEECLRLDPNFMAAANALSIAHSLLFSLYEKDTAARMNHAVAAKRWADRASQLMPGGAGDRALTYYYTNVVIDNVRALALSVKAVQAWPNDAGVCNLMAMALGGVGRMVEGSFWSSRAVALDPCNLTYRVNQLSQLGGLRRRDEWNAAIKELREITQGVEIDTIHIPRSRYRLFGELPNLKEIEGMRPIQQRTYLWLGRRFAEAERILADQLAGKKLGDLDRFETQLRQCDVLRRLGRNDEAEQMARDTLVLAEKLGKAAEIDPSEKDGRLAQALTRASRYEEAIGACRRYVEAARIPERQSLRWIREVKLAEIYAEANRPRECLDLVARLLREPTWLTVPMLRVDPVWDNLRGNPQFEALLNDPKNDAPF